MRKVFGGKKKQLILQFLSEALLFTAVAGVISLVLYEILRPVFSQVLNTTFESLFQFNTTIVFYVVVLIILKEFYGIYPAFVLSSLKEVSAVKGKIDTAKGGLLLRKAMLVFQFALATVVLISAFTVSKQVSYLFSKDIGYNKEQVLGVTAFPKQWDSTGTNG